MPTFSHFAVALLAGLSAVCAHAQNLAPRLIVPRLVINSAIEQPIRLAHAEVATELTPNAAQTRVVLRFFNPNARMLEGELQFPLAPGQSIAGFALDVDGVLRDAVPVDKPKAQAIFEDIQRVRIDPGLLERTEGNNYKLRVYPIPAGGSRTVALRIVEGLSTNAGVVSYQLPALAAAQPGEFRLSVTANGFTTAPTLVMANAAVTPRLSFTARNGGFYAETIDPAFTSGAALQARASAGPRILTEERAGITYVHADLPVGERTPARFAPRHLALVWDASGSGLERDHARELATIEHYLRRLGTVRVTLYWLRDQLETAGEFHITSANDSALSSLRRTLTAAHYDGATRLGAIVSVAAADAMLLVTDGLSTYDAGIVTPPSMPTHIIAAAARSHPQRLARLASRTGGRFVDLTQVTPQAAAGTLLTVPEYVTSVTGDGLRDVALRSMHVADGRVVFSAILSAATTNVRIELAGPRGIGRVVALALSRDTVAASGIAAAMWAESRVAILEDDYAVNRMAIRRIGTQLGIATRETSLLVLERIEDYVRNEIEPPAPLRAAYDAQRLVIRRRGDQDRAQHLDQVAARFAERVMWWERRYPQDPPKQSSNVAPNVAPLGGTLRRDADQNVEIRQRSETTVGARAAPSVTIAGAPRPATAPMAAPAPAMAAESKRTQDVGSPAARIALKAWTPDAPYMKRFAAAHGEALYRVYLDERAGYTASTAFFLDATDVFLARGEPALALRVLSNLAEMDLENRHILRILGYRLMQADAPAIAVPIFERVLTLAPNEPQSHRDLGLALARSGEPQRAIEALYEVVARPWDARFPQIDLVALAELNAIIASADKKLNTAHIDSRLLRNLPLDLRVVMGWDADNTDIDLWVTDPNGERAFYGHRNTLQGGRMSADFTGGYGPEEFVLRRAKAGKYKIEANFYGNRQQVVAGATTLMLALQTQFGTANVREQRVTLRLREANERVFVGEFEVGAPNRTTD